MEPPSPSWRAGTEICEFQFPGQSRRLLVAPAGAPYTYTNVRRYRLPDVTRRRRDQSFPRRRRRISIRTATSSLPASKLRIRPIPPPIRGGALVGTFKSQPTNLDWFVVGYGTTLTVPAGGADLYLAVNDSYNPDNHGSYSVSIHASNIAAPAITLSNTTTNTPVPVAGAVSLSSDGLTLNFVPAVQLAASANLHDQCPGRDGLRRQCHHALHLAVRNRHRNRHFERYRSQLQPAKRPGHSQPDAAGDAYPRPGDFADRRSATASSSIHFR